MQGIPDPICWRMYEAIGVTGRNRKLVVRDQGKVAERASSWLWVRRGESSWKLIVEDRD